MAGHWQAPRLLDVILRTDCDVPPVDNGGAGSCTTTLATGDECWADCASGYNTSGPTRCYLGRLQ